MITPLLLLLWKWENVLYVYAAQLCGELCHDRHSSFSGFLFYTSLGIGANLKSYSIRLGPASCPIQGHFPGWIRHCPFYLLHLFHARGWMTFMGLAGEGSGGWGWPWSTVHPASPPSGCSILYPACPLLGKACPPSSRITKMTSRFFFFPPQGSYWTPFWLPPRVAPWGENLGQVRNALTIPLGWETKLRVVPSLERRF
jgi:hypothetical protein